MVFGTCRCIALANVVVYTFIELGAMNYFDWLVLGSALLFITLYGVWKTRGQKNIAGYLRGDNTLPWWMIALSVMATQASAITFMSTPGQAYQDGMGFLQFYFGLPLAMIVICTVFLPIFSRLKVYTAYEFLENRFDLKTRTLTAILFLIQRGLAAGITIYAPAIILSTIMGWRLTYTNLVIGVLVIIYTVAGGTKAVSQTQKQQMIVIFIGMFLAFYTALSLLPENFGLMDSVKLAGASGRMDVINWKLDWNERYNVWSGLTGGFFLALSYFGTDQSQVARYISGKSLREMRLGLILNGIVKIPMQFFILLTGILVFVVFQFHDSPVFFNQTLLDSAREQPGGEVVAQLQQKHREIESQKHDIAYEIAKKQDWSDRRMLAYRSALKAEKENREEAKRQIRKLVPDAETRDTDYVFLNYVLRFLPHGVIGLLLAVIFSAAMSSTSSEINALASTTVIDLYKRGHQTEKSEGHYLKASRWFTLAWGALAILFATTASLFENLIQAVNILGSLFYGTILGIFLTAFFLKQVGGKATFIAAFVAEAVVLACYVFSDLGFLWFNAIGCAVVMGVALLIQGMQPAAAE